MTYPRLIPVILLKHGLIVRSELFRIHQVIGNPMSTIERLSHWNVDELILLDISGDDFHDLRRDDIQQRYGGSGVLDVLEQVAARSFMPLAFGGRIRTLDDIRARLSAGADKCVINTQAIERPQLIEEAAARFGSQCVVVSIDAERGEDGRVQVMSRAGKVATGLDPAEWARRAEELGAGEIFLNSVDRDGTARGYDLELVGAVSDITSIPVIACGGVGSSRAVRAPSPRRTSSTSSS
jgi:imidazoleglycerol phosphate synthase cyclase subunit